MVSRADHCSEAPVAWAQCAGGAAPLMQASGHVVLALSQFAHVKCNQQALGHMEDTMLQREQGGPMRTVRDHPLEETSQISVDTVAAVMMRLEAAQQAISRHCHATTDSMQQPPTKRADGRAMREAAEYEYYATSRLERRTRSVRAP